ncbi:MAG: Hint domain-containing protein [Cognatishimia activa]
MPTYTVEAFRWTGTYYNSQYNTSYQATFSDNDGAYQGGGDSDEQVQIDGGSFNSTASQPYKIAVSFTDTNGNSHVEDFNFFYTSDGGWYFVPEPDSEFTVGATLGSYQSHSVGWDYSDVVCFVSGTMIETPEGAKPIETLCAGDLVTCGEGQTKPLAYVLKRAFSERQLERNEKLRPVRITAGAIGLGVPKRDLLVSRQHRMLVKSKISKNKFGQEDALVAAIKLTILPGIFLEPNIQDTTYYHLGFEDHEIVFAEGAPAESLLHGDDTDLITSPEAQAELEWLLPFSNGTPTTPKPKANIPSPSLQKTIVQAHLRKGRNLRK